MVRAISNELSIVNILRGNNNRNAEKPNSISKKSTQDLNLHTELVTVELSDRSIKSVGLENNSISKKVIDKDNESNQELSPEDKEILNRLKRIDQEIRAHEQIHASVGGAYARGGPTFQFTIGPDGKRYAMSGHVDIEASVAATPEETIRKARQIKAAATAPKNPSSADLMIAAQASNMEAEARADLTRKMMIMNKGGGEKSSDISVEDRTVSDQLLSLLGAIPIPQLKQDRHSSEIR